jgi:hypothetical protein
MRAPHKNVVGVRRYGSGFLEGCERKDFAPTFSHARSVLHNYFEQPQRFRTASGIYGEVRIPPKTILIFQEGR